MERIPVWLLTGFLGSGKTTLLNRLLSGEGMRDTAVVVNEFGSIPIDHHLVSAATENVIVLDNGCLCCAVRGDLSDALRELFIKQMQGEIPAFSRLVIETTGLADPAPAIHTLVTDLVIADRYRLEGVVTVVDQQAIAGQLAQHREARRQVELADCLAISKTDLAGFDREGIEQLLRQHNPDATLSIASAGSNLSEVFRSYDAAWLSASDAVVEEGRYLGGQVQRHGAGLRSIALDVALAPLDWERFSEFLSALQREHGEAILRVKGLLWVHGEEQPIVVHCVQHVFYPVERLGRWPTERKASQLVIIGRGLQDTGEIERQFLACALPAGQPSMV